MGKEALASPNPQRRLARIVIAPELLLELFKLGPGGRQVIDGRVIESIGDPLPETSRALRCSIDESGYVQLLVEDESFQVVEPGWRIPQLHLLYQVTAVERGD